MLTRSIISLAFVAAVAGAATHANATEITPEFPIATGIATADSDTENPGRPALGFDGTNYLVVSCREIGSPPGIFGVILSGTGTVLKTFHISEHETFFPHHCTSGGFPNPAVAFDGTNYLVVFHRRGQIIGTRVSPSGDVLDGPSGFDVSSGVPFSVTNFFPAVSFDGTNYLVVWAKFVNNTHDIFGARVTPGGQVLDEFSIFSATGGQISPSVAFDGVNFLVAWSDTRSGSPVGPDADIFGARVTPGGVILDPDGISISTAAGIQDAPQVSFDGTNYFVAWVDGRNDVTSSQPGLGIFGTRVDPDGTLLDGPPDTGGLAISATTGQTVGRHLAVAFDGASYITISSVETYSTFPPAGIFAARVSTTGNVVDGGLDIMGISISEPECFSCRLLHPRILFGDGTSLVTWVMNSELFESSKGIAGALISPNQPPLANAGTDQNAIEGAILTLNGASSSDPDGDLLLFNWTQISGPPVALINANTATPSFTAPDVGTNGVALLFQLVVSDGLLESAPDTVSITVTSPRDIACAVVSDIQALIDDPATSAKAIKFLQTALSNVNGACALLMDPNFLAAFAQIKTASSSLEKAATSGAPTQPIIEDLREIVRATTNWKIAEAAAKVCASEKNVQKAQNTFDKALAAAKASQAVQMFASAFQSAERGISNQVDLTGPWVGQLIAKQGPQSGVLQLIAEFDQLNTSFTGTFQDSFGNAGRISGTICGLIVDEFKLHFDGEVAAGSGKADKSIRKLNIKLAGTDSGGPFTVRGTITKQ